MNFIGIQESTEVDGLFTYASMSVIERSCSYSTFLSLGFLSFFFSIFINVFYNVFQGRSIPQFYLTQEIQPPPHYLLV